MTDRRFRPGWKMTLFAAALLPVLLSFGIWQLGRAEEKRLLEEQMLDRIGALPAVPGPTVVDFQHIRLHGTYEATRTFLLDNQTHAGEVGYGVITSFRADDGRRWLVNRGFIRGDPGRRSLPAVQTPTGDLTLTGLVWPELGLLPSFGDDRWNQDWPKVIQRLEVARMAADLENAVPREIRLDAGAPGVLVPATTSLNMPAAKHTGYAVQWFGLAFVLAAGYLYFGFRRRDGAND
ncbi:MAG: SURF1 family protein [Pseudomonadales bacterium]